MPLAARAAPLCPAIEHVDRAGRGGRSAPIRAARAPVWTLRGVCSTTHGAPSAWGDFDENDARRAVLHLGHHGRPKGVVYTHRSNYLHTLRALQADAIALTARDDVLLVAVPMFHANGWGLPFAAPAAGAKLVLPGRDARRREPGALIMRDEGVTVAVGVQTVWLGLVDHLDASRRRAAGARSAC